MKKITLLFIFLLGCASTSLALPMVNTPGNGFEDRSDGTVFGYYQNSGQLLFTQLGNNIGNVGNLALAQQLTRIATGNPSLVLTITPNINFQSYDGNSGTWATVPPLGPNGTIDFYAVKAGDYYAMYLVNPAASTGSWSTYDIWALDLPGTGGHPPNGGGGLGISHFTGYNPSSSVPEPGTVLLLCAGLSGIVLLRRFRR